MSVIMNLANVTTPTDLIALVRDTSAELRARETDLMLLAAAWADAHPDLDAEPEPCDPHEDRDPDKPDPRVPALAGMRAPSFAAALGVSTASGEAMIRDTLVVRHRLPGVWERVLAHEVAVWRARRIAQAVHGKPDDVVAHIDETVAPIAEKVGPVILDCLIDEAMMRLYPEERELAQLEALDACHVTLHEESLNETGVGEMTIRGDWKDLHDFDETVSLVADRLAEVDVAEGRVPDSRDVRRSRAVGVLADPEAAAATARRPAGADAQAPRHARVPPERGRRAWARPSGSQRDHLAASPRAASAGLVRSHRHHLTVLPSSTWPTTRQSTATSQRRLKAKVDLLYPTCVSPGVASARGAQGPRVAH